MKIYLGHSSAFDYCNLLYQPLKNSFLWEKYAWILPHDQQIDPVNSKNRIAECEWMVAEVSHPSTGLGIELGWANLLGCKILYIHQQDCLPSTSLKILSSDFFSYKDPKEMIQKLEAFF